WEGYPEEGWYPSLKKELEKKGFEVNIPTMPDTDEPRIKPWVSKIAEIVGKPDNETYFVGHSIGCLAILRYLQTLPEETKIGGVVFVAGFFELSELETEEEKIIVKPWLETPIYFDKIKRTTNNFVAIFSDDDPYVPKKNVNTYKEKLGAKIIMEKGKGHFAGDDNIKELPIVLEELLRIS
ncbi:MAG TPA: hypothetical protein ENI22_00035, partial [Candidatus Pacearchaeota archaeon]|nr:hypothetical protein [Candidatus Pacearchaeota archaeon]